MMYEEHLGLSEKMAKLFVIFDFCRQNPQISRANDKSRADIAIPKHTLTQEVFDRGKSISIKEQA